MIDIKKLEEDENLEKLAEKLSKTIDNAVNEFVDKNKSTGVIKIKADNINLNGKDYTLDDLRQKLINCLYNRIGKLEYSGNEIELLKIILEYKK